MDKTAKTALALIAILAIMLAVFGKDDSPPADTQAAASATPIAEPKLDDAAVAKCGALIAKGLKSGIIRERRQPTRIDVDDGLWAALDARTKDVVLRAVACEVWRQYTPPENEFVVSYGWRSGKRIEMLTSVGVFRD